MSVPRVRHPHLCIQHGLTRHDPGRVSPFGNPRIKVRLATPRGISQPATSFIASWRQGIHHLPFFSLTKTARAGIRRSPLRISSWSLSALIPQRRHRATPHSATSTWPRRSMHESHSLERERFDFQRSGTRNNPEDRMTRVRPSHTPCAADGHGAGTAEVVELIGIEPTTSGLQSPRSPS